MTTGGYDPVFFDRLARVEDRHFWFRARNQLILSLARRIGAEMKPGGRILEVGCGTGNVLRYLERACPRAVVCGMDLWLEGLRYARGRSGCSLVQGDMRTHPFATRFDLIGMFDVLEHIPDDRQTLRHARVMLAPRGRLLLTVPAHQSLWSYFDESAHHCRRYCRAELVEKLIDAGYEIEASSEFMASTFPLLWLTRRLAGLRDSKNHDGKKRELALDEFRIVPVVNELLTWILAAEMRWLARGHSLPLGSSLLVLARRSD
jgi:SAM-dependent methyltransferase